MSFALQYQDGAERGFKALNEMQDSRTWAECLRKCSLKLNTSHILVKSTLKQVHG